MQELLSEAKKGKFSSIRDNLSDDDVASVWDNVSAFIEKQMAQQKGVKIPGFGTFTFTQKKIDIGNNKFILMQRPVFNISENLAQIHALHFTKYHVPGQIPVVMLNFSAMSFESPYDRDTVEMCVKEILNTVSRAVGSRRNVELVFSGIGRLTIRENRVKMKFFKDFVNQMDGSGALVDAMQNRPGTVDSVMSERCLARPLTGNTLVLPKNSDNNHRINTSSNVIGLAAVTETEEDMGVGPRGGGGDMLLGDPLDEAADPDPTMVAEAIAEEQAMEQMNVAPEHVSFPELPQGGDIYTDAAIDNILNEGHETTTEGEGQGEGDGGQLMPLPPGPVRTMSRVAMPMAMATGVSLLDDVYKPPSRASLKPLTPLLARSSTTPYQGMGMNAPEPLLMDKPMSAGHPEPLDRAATFVDQSSLEIERSRQHSADCGHPQAGQELCYLCHQRSRRNIPVSFTAERRRRDAEEEHLLQQYASMKDAEDTLAEHERFQVKKRSLMEQAAFNLGIADANILKKKNKDPRGYRSYLFQNRPLTPPRLPRQIAYHNDLSKQVDAREKDRTKKQSDEKFLGRLEQIQLTEDLAVQREQYQKEKLESTDIYKKSLDSQLKYKPVPLPSAEPNAQMFGKNDTNNEKMAERRRLAQMLSREQQEHVAQRKREAILKRLSEQQQQEDVLLRTRTELIDDRANRHHIRFASRRHLEDDWSKAAEMKHGRDLEDRLRSLSPGRLVHEQCDKYHRCKQCQRQLRNCGETNIWSETRYIPGSRLMV